MKKYQKGFTLPHVLLVAVMLLVVAGVGYYVYRANQNINKNLDITTTSQNTPQTSDKKDEEPQANDAESSTTPDGWVKFTDEKTGVSFYHPASIKGFSTAKYDIDEDVPLGYGAPVWWRYNAESDTWKTYKVSPDSTTANTVKEPTKNAFTLTKNKVNSKATFSATVGEGGGSTLTIVFPSSNNIYRIYYPGLNWRTNDTSATEKTEDTQKASVEQLIKTIKL